ncbi:DUF397 domain-containing protein [Nocardia sp. CDC160]|uniref:DUF397 domain-containing protein n=1 Tax=Nocardia sp. CDC160 TaxID=3112166 RepID=UPI002DBA53B7|nr:DUF397 domain-containing protein [Nocardia sp. CDC160]MEC3919307.1 DUF397 domain-containing protein [Nocardia sp. CDC160]
MATAGSSGGGWRKSTYSGSNGGACVEVLFDGPIVRIRDSKYIGNPLCQPEIAVSAVAWATFLEVVWSEESRPLVSDVPSVEIHSRGTVLRDVPGTTLEYTSEEWKAFLAGVRDGEFGCTFEDQRV